MQIEGSIGIFPQRVHRPFLFINPVLAKTNANVPPYRFFPSWIPKRSSNISDSKFVDIRPDSQELVLSGMDYRKAVNSDIPNPFPKAKIGFYVSDIPWLINHQGSDNNLDSEIVLDFIPTEIKFSQDSTFTPIKVVGSNNRPLHYGGSEDTVTIKIDWYGYKEGPVVKKCRFFELLTKADGWRASPPVVKIAWGVSPVFQGRAFVVVKAPYVLSLFQRSRIYKEDLSNLLTRHSYDLMPIRASQTLTLKEVTGSQKTHKEIGDFPTFY